MTDTLRLYMPDQVQKIADAAYERGVAAERQRTTRLAEQLPLCQACTRIKADLLAGRDTHTSPQQPAPGA